MLDRLLFTKENNKIKARIEKITYRKEMQSRWHLNCGKATKIESSVKIPGFERHVYATFVLN